MPTWGPPFGSVSGKDEAIVSMRISNLITYLESLQVNDPAGEPSHVAAPPPSLR